MQKLKSCPSHPALLRLFVGLMVLLCGATPALSDTEGLLPSLDSKPAAETPGMTPITELIGQPEPIEPEESGARPTPVSAATADVSPKAAKQAAKSEKPSTQSEKKTAKSEKPAVMPEKSSSAAQTERSAQPIAKAKPVQTVQLKPSPSPKQKQAAKISVPRLDTANEGLKPLVDEQQASSMPGMTPNALMPQLTDDFGHDLQPLHQNESEPVLTPLHPQSAEAELSPLQGNTADALTPLHPQADSPALKPAAAASTVKDSQNKPASVTKTLTAQASHQGKPKSAEMAPEVKPVANTEATPKISAEAKKSRKEKKAEENAAAPVGKHQGLNLDVSQAIQNAKQTLMNGTTSVQPISYTPLPGIAVFAVLKHGNERAFGDLPVMFAREYAQRLGAQLPKTKVYNPIYTVDELRMQGLGHIYDQIMTYYIKTGAPEPTATSYLLKQISTNRPDISRLVFVEADVDYSHPDSSTSLIERTKQMMTDAQPKQMKYFVVSRLQIFDAEKPDFPIVWAGSWKRSIKTDQFYNVTPSVFADSDSQRSFAAISRQMSQEMIYITPKEAYMAPNFDTDVEGRLVSGKQPATPALPDSQTAKSSGLSNENKQAIERILQRQNDLSPK